jgi:uncharacterized protein
MFDALREVLHAIPAPVVAVSGGVDSVTLAGVAVAVHPDTLLMHATSPAVPPQATRRVAELAAQRGWNLSIIVAGEFADPNYRANPVNRCFFCKTNLYAAIGARTDRQILSGANLDDLGEYRPGLDAARNHAVRHPYIEAGIDKAAVRQIARRLGLGEVAELPASPCLSSRVETGIRIEAETLGFINRVERLVDRQAHPRTVRCRVRAEGIVIELDGAALAALSDAASRDLLAAIAAERGAPPDLPVKFETYRNGSAFLRS